ncbi:MAG TPA: ABC transporter transmembrane domain-containing protein [Longimicrobiaceae bacterium]|nr:ABC transporter transmembrane domain-containing protein [Longimicrobiaceae bacterium]
MFSVLRTRSPKFALSELLPRLRPHRAALAATAVLLLLTSSVALAFPRIVGYLLDAAFVRGDGGMLDRIAVGLIALFAIQAVLQYAQTYLLTATGERVMAGLRTDLFSHLVTLPASFFAERRTGELMSRLTTDVGALQTVLRYQISEFLRQILFLIGAIVLLTLTHPRLTVTTLAVVPIVVGAAFFFGRRLRKVSTDVQDHVAAASASAEEAIAQIRIVQSFVQERAERARYAEHIGTSVRVALGRAHVRGVFFAAMAFCIYGAIVVVLWQGGRLVLSGQLTAGTLVSFLLYAVTVAAAVGSLTSLWSSYQEAAGAAARVFELLATHSELPEPAAPKLLPRPVRGEVRFDGVSFHYDRAADPEEQEGAEALDEGGARRWVLHDIDLHVRAGETVALVGPSGAGKTTLVSLVPRFWDPQHGTISLDGIDLRDLALADLRSAVGVVPQETLLFSGTIRENLAYARPDATQAEIEAAARAAHAHEFIRLLSDGYDTVVGERGVKLSGGQRQRIAIGRALLKDPAVLILDEATSNLDAESEALIEDALEVLLRGRTTLIIAHRLSTVRRADRLVVLDEGGIVEEGTHEELLAHGGIYARLYARQFRDRETLGTQQTQTSGAA